MKWFRRAAFYGSGCLFGLSVGLLLHGKFCQGGFLMVTSLWVMVTLIDQVGLDETDP